MGVDVESRNTIMNNDDVDEELRALSVCVQSIIFWIWKYTLSFDRFSW